MSQFHRFFFVFGLMIFLPIIFLLAITIYPIFLGVKMLCKSYGRSKAPIRPTPPPKPEKPLEPAIGSSKEDWNKYREALNAYKKAKMKWKEKMKNFYIDKNKIMDKYYRKSNDYKKKYEDDEDETFYNCMVDATEYMLFYRISNCRLMNWLIKNYKS